MLTVIFNVRSWKMRKKNRQNMLAIMIKPRTSVNQHVQPYICTQFGVFSLKNEPGNAKRSWLIKGSIMHIFNEAEPPLSNSSKILGQ